MARPAQLDHAELLRLYHDEGLTLKEVGEVLGVSTSTVHRHIGFAGSQTRGRTGETGERSPRWIGEVDWDEAQRMLDAGAYLNEVAAHFGFKNGSKGLRTRAKKEGRELVLQPRTADRAPAWKGKGWYKTRRGYVMVLAPGHPYADARGYVREHRLMMEDALGRYLEPQEVVHHRNGITDDNRLENLEWFATNVDHIRATRTGVPQRLTPEQKEHHREATKEGMRRWKARRALEGERR